jgi:hypothetical protein
MPDYMALLAEQGRERGEELGRQELIASNCSRIARALIRQGKSQNGLSYARRAVDIYTRLESPDLSWVQELLQECLEGEE